MNFEDLESRRLLSVSFNLDSSGLLTVIGTKNSEQIHLGSIKTFKTDFAKTGIDYSKVKRILVNMMGGNDVVVFNDAMKVPITLIGGSGDDSLRGGGGDDVFIADAHDTLCGGDGFDRADFSASPTGIKFDMTDATIEAVQGSNFADSITGSAKNDIILGEGGNDTINGMSGDDYIDGGTGADRMNGNKGDDIFLNFDNQGDTLDGGSGTDFAEEDGKDTMTRIDFIFDQQSKGSGGGGESGGGTSGGTESGATLQTLSFLGAPHAALALQIAALPIASIDAGVLTINGDSGDNRISVTMDSTGTKINVSVDGEVASFALADVDSISIDAGDGNDVVALQKSDGTRDVPVGANILGGAGDDTIIGGSGNDTVDGEAGNDSIMGMLGRDSLSGGFGNDTLDGGEDNDYLNGGSTDISTRDGADVFIGGAGNDSAMYTTRTDDLSIDILNGSKANDGAASESDDVNADVENIYSGTGDDTLTGNASANLISGNAGDDVIKGNGGHDKLIGGAGHDTITSGADSSIFSMLDLGRDDFDVSLDSNGHPTSDFVSGDVGADFSTVSGRSIG
jgi:Ca2+-binding RTX toxin-like protein